MGEHRVRVPGAYARSRPELRLDLRERREEKRRLGVPPRIDVLHSTVSPLPFFCSDHDVEFVGINNRGSHLFRNAYYNIRLIVFYTEGRERERGGVLSSTSYSSTWALFGAGTAVTVCSLAQQFSPHK